MSKKTICVSLALLLLIGGLSAWLWLGDNASPEFSRVKQLQDKLLHDDSLTAAEQDAGWIEVKQKWSSLSKSEQKQLSAQFKRKDQDQIERFCALKTDEERNALLDRALDQWEEIAAQKRNKQSGKGREEKKNRDAKVAKAKQNGKEKIVDPEAERAGLRGFLDSQTADERAKQRIYYTALKRRWAERHGSK